MAKKANKIEVPDFKEKQQTEADFKIGKLVTVDQYKGKHKIIAIDKKNKKLKLRWQHNPNTTQDFEAEFKSCELCPN